MHTINPEVPATVLSFSETCEALGISRKELHRIIDDGELETITNVDGREFVVFGDSKDLDYDELERYDLLEESL